MPGAFTGVGFGLCVLSEPQPDPAACEWFPEDFQEWSTKFGFLFFALEAPHAPV